MKNFKTANGCRPSQFVGPWAMDQAAYDELFDQAAILLANPETYERVARESREQAKEDMNSPYEVDTHGIAHLAASGVLTRDPHSMQAALGGTSTALLQRAIQKAAADPEVRGAMLHMNTPGGPVNGMEDTSNEIARFRATGKPFATHIGGQGTSAGYRLAVESDHISIDPLGITGSVGILTKMRDTSELMRRAGVKDHWLGSGDRKSAGAAGKEITPEQIAEEQARINEAGEVFVSAVRARRAMTDENAKDVARAGIYNAKRAKDIGLVDRVCDTRQAIESFVQRISSGSSSGSALPPATQTAGAPQNRSSTMLTPEQLTQAKALPGCGDISAENADGKLLAAALSQHAIASRVPTLETEIGTLRQQAPTPIPLNVLKGMASAARTQMQSAIGKQAVTPAVANQLAASLIGEGDNLNAVALAPTATGESMASMVFSALASNGEAPRVGEQTQAQPAPKAVAGAPADAAITPERIKELMEATPLGMSALASGNGKH
jgi:signal peptide peptidase SppA